MPKEHQALDQLIALDHLAFDPVVCALYKKLLNPDHELFGQLPNNQRNKSNETIRQVLPHKDYRWLDRRRSDSSYRLKVGSQAWHSSQPEILGLLFTYRTLYPIFFAHKFDFYQ
jgi:hypothetical protein